MNIRHAVENSWREPNLLTVLLWPISCLYRALFALRTRAYRIGFFSSYRAPVPVVVVGNLTVGGTGKTPLIIYLIEQLREQGFKPGVISRGYGGQAERYPCYVDRLTPVEHSGDEPALIVRRTGVPMVVSPDRGASITYLISMADVDVVLSDDGLQHLALERDIEICLLDATSPLNNTHMLPAGPYREPRSRLQSVDFVVEHGLSKDQPDVYAMNLTPGLPKPLLDNNAKSFDTESSFHAVAGIGNPQRFFNTCRSLGYRFTEHVFPDHHAFVADDLNFDADRVLMTEKDAVKCYDFADSRLWYLPVDATLSDDFVDALTERIVDAKRQLD